MAGQPRYDGACAVPCREMDPVRSVIAKKVVDIYGRELSLADKIEPFNWPMVLGFCVYLADFPGTPFR